MNDLQNNRLVRAFAEARAAGRKMLVPFITGGYPDVDATLALLWEFEARGVRVCEIGIPFSDPVADGPVIQDSYTRTLADGRKLIDIEVIVDHYRAKGGKLAIAMMVSYSIAFRHGLADFCRDAAQRGFDALIVPDLPLEEAGELGPLASANGLAHVLLVAPTTTPARRIEIARRSRGFLYYVSVAGITGQRDCLPEAAIRGVAELRRHTDTPVCVGFGISRPETVAQVCAVADGAIVGSAIVGRITQGLDAGTPRAKIVDQVGQFVSELLAPLNGRPQA